MYFDAIFERLHEVECYFQVYLLLNDFFLVVDATKKKNDIVKQCFFLAE